MSQMIPLTINDGQSTPQSLTFDIQSAQSGDKPAVWMEKSQGTYNGFRMISTLLRRSGQGSGSGYKVQIQIKDPKLAVTAPASGTGIQPKPTVSYVNRVNLEFMLPDGCTTQDRKDLYAFLVDVLSEQLIKDQVVNLSAVY